MENKNKFVDYFKRHEESLARQYAERPEISKPYLEKRWEYKMVTFFRPEHDHCVTDINQEFQRLLSHFSGQELKNFIIMTSIQDVIIFGRLMINKATNQSTRDSVSIEDLVIREKKKYESLHTQYLTTLPYEAKRYIIDSREPYKRDLYLRKIFSIETFNTVNRFYRELLQKLDQKAQKNLVKASMYQDLKIICELHLFDLIA